MNALTSLLHAVLLTLVVTTTSALAHEGHDHDQKPAVTAAALPRLEAASGPFELTALLRQGVLIIYLDGFATNEPMTDAQITVETPKGPLQAKAKDGIYRLDAPWAREGALDLIFTVTHGEVTELLSGSLVVNAENQGTGSSLRVVAQEFTRTFSFGANWVLLVVAFAAGGVLTFLVTRRTKWTLLTLFLPLLLLSPEPVKAHEGHDHGDKAKGIVTGEVSQRLADGSLFVPKPVQRILAIRTTVTEQSKHRKTIELPGRIIPDPNASGFVQASVSGRLAPPEGGFPRLGTAVKAGDVLAFVYPPFQAIDVSDMRQKQGELDQQIEIVSKRVARYESLIKSGTVSRVNYDEAVAELKGLKDRRAALDKTRGEAEKLIAPVTGIIASVNAVSGQIAETNAVVFQIIDPARLWVEALTFSLLPEADTATARTSEGATLALKFQGAGLTDRSQAIPVHFAIDGTTKGLRVGQLVTVLAATGEESEGLAVPRAAVLKTSNGQTVLFEHTRAELFEPRIVRIEPLDAERVLVLDGIGPGKRIVVQGAELLNQIR